MGESKLTLDYDDYLREVSFWLGHGQAPTGTTLADVEGIMNSGLRQFYTAHDWSFLKPVKTLVTWQTIEQSVDEAVGTVTLTRDSANTFTCNTATFTSSMVDKYVSFLDDASTATSLKIATVANSTQLTTTSDSAATTAVAFSVAPYTVTAAANVLTADNSEAPFYQSMEGKAFSINMAGTLTERTVSNYISPTQIEYTGGNLAATKDSFEIAPSGDYRLPDDFGGHDGMFTYGQDEGWQEIPWVGESQVRSQRQFNYGTAKPRMAALKVINPVEGATEGQRFEVMLWPSPDSAYNLTCRYLALTSRLSINNKHPLGGQRHCETILASMLAVGELRRNDEQGPQYADYQRLLAMSVEDDQRFKTPEYLGYNDERSNEKRSAVRGRRNRGRGYNSYTVTVQGNTP